ncbi:hypothetical protein GOBAR_DD18006 [Gossypium barbadense]|nr:hypothetical protein GOBAR_DD18006 [Gossypium barbadense]
MQHIPTTVEEQLFFKAVKEECPWENLPKRLQAIFNSKEEWHRRIIEHCIKKRLQWDTCFARKICKENEYYEELMRVLRKSLADQYSWVTIKLFPYYLAEYICRVMRVSPFRYYCDMIFDLMRNAKRLKNSMEKMFPSMHLPTLTIPRHFLLTEQPYDSIPNFSAADALRLTGIGRNEFIDIMNKCKSKKIMWKLSKSIAKELLPTQPVDFPIEPWWGVSLVNFTVEEFKKLSEDETAMIDKICKEEANAYVLFDPDIIKGLYRRGLVYFDVPVYPDDRIKVCRLEGFISNKEQSYEDPIEELLYAVFVVSRPDQGKGTPRKRKRYRVDILRCESLASLPKATLDRLFLRDYDIIVSMIPLPHSSVLPGPTGPIHFGPPSHSSMTPWMKLVLYSTVASGPLSIVLMKGLCLRMLPAPLAGCEKALIWSWDDSTTGSLGGKLEGNLVKGSILLHCLNSMLKHSAVIVQPFSIYDLDGSGKVVTVDIPLPLKNSDGSVAPVGDKLGLCAGECLKLNDLLTVLAHKIELWTIGYIRLLKLFKERESDNFGPNGKYEWVPLTIEFGMPLFNPKLCNNICERIVSSELLQVDSLTEHHNSMQNMQRKLRDFCAEYQATGPAAKLLYLKELQKDGSKDSEHDINYPSSGKWNPLVDPSSPISGASNEHQRFKLACRQRSRTEVLSFDASILRSFAVTPVYEAGTRSVEDSPAATAPRVDLDETDSGEVILPGLNLIFDGAELNPFDIAACLQARQPISLIAEAASASTSFAIN